MKLKVFVSLVALATLNHSINGYNKRKCSASIPIDRKCGQRIRIAWTYNLGVCWQFSYTGCLINKRNMYNSLAQCEKTCSRRSHS